ncbi:phage tail spike protein [Clostridioides difficile]
MIEIYNKSNKNFIFNGDMILKPYLCDLEVELNGIIEVTLEHPYDKEGRWKCIVEDNMLRVPYPWKEEGQLFYIYDKEKGMTGVRCKARHIFFDLASEILIDCRLTNATGQEALNKILDGTGFTGYSNIIARNSAYYIRKHIANEALISEDENSFINRWGGELDVDNFHVYMNERTGGEHGVTFRYGQDLIDLKENSNIDGIITRILPVGFNGITIPEHYVDSPLINKYRKIKTDVIKFDHIKVKESPEDEGYNTLEEAQEALREACKQMFDEGIDKLLYQIDVEVAKLENTLKYKDYKNLLEVGLGDTVGVEHLDIGINIKTRVIKFVYDCISEKFKNITLGNYIENYIDTQNNTENILNRILNNDGSVKANEVQGFIDSTKAMIRAQKSIAQKQHIRAMLFEDLDESSETYGAVALGTLGLMCSRQRTPDGRDWDFTTAITAEGIIADKIVGRLFASKNGLTKIYMETGKFESQMPDGSKIVISPTDGFYNMFGSSKREYHHLNYTTTISDYFIGSERNKKRIIQLPDEFKGKKFSAVVSVVDVRPGSSPATINSFSNSITSYDYENGRVEVSLYASSVKFNYNADSSNEYAVVDRNHTFNELRTDVIVALTVTA